MMQMIIMTQEGTHFANEGTGDGSAKSSCAKLLGRPLPSPASPLLASSGDSSPLPVPAPPHPRPCTRDGPATAPAPAPPAARTTGAPPAAHDSDDGGVDRFTAERDLGSRRRPKPSRESLLSLCCWCCWDC